MSTMTKFLKQTCTFEPAVRDASGTVLSDYGDITYGAAVTLKCRREKYARDMQTSTGAIVRVSSRYFVDEAVEVQTDDRLDGHVVQACEEYIDQFGHCIGFEAYV